jgi:iron complex outermembrane recepter protein
MLKTTTLTLAGVSLLAMATPAFGQASPPQASPAAADALDDTGELAPTNEIIVSARRRAESVQDVPQTVNVVTSAQIDKLNLRTFTDVASVVPGLTLTDRERQQPHGRVLHQRRSDLVKPDFPVAVRRRPV